MRRCSGFCVFWPNVAGLGLAHWAGKVGAPAVNHIDEAAHGQQGADEESVSYTHLTLPTNREV